MATLVISFYFTSGMKNDYCFIQSPNTHAGLL
jgi:hypothetical protein